MKTTNYYNTNIDTAEDCPVQTAEIPMVKEGKKTIANIQFEMIMENPYQYTSDDVIFNVYALKNNISKTDAAKERTAFFSKGQACLRASPLPKRYGWGIHFNEEGKIAIYAAGSEEYTKLAADKNLKHLKAVRSKRA